LGSPDVDRLRLLAGILAGLETRYRTWSHVSGDAERAGLRAEYTGLCATLGRRVRVELPGGRPLDGLAAGVDPDGRLLVSVPSGPEVPVAAGDIVHLR
jgi:BirA family biotin operon repressor/biotin-[acetyl-CoA-carboxylase] ligase